MNIFVIDVGGTNVKIWKSGERDSEKFKSGKRLTPRRLLDRLRKHTQDWNYDRVSLGYPGAVRHGHPIAEPFNLGDGWVDFDWSSAFDCPFRIMNDACLQALGSYEGGRMLYLGLGTGLGTAFIYDGQIIPLALGHLLAERGEEFGRFLGRDGLERHGKKLWREVAIEAALSLKSAFIADYVVFGGGNARRLGKLPDGCRKGGNHNAYFGGLRLWQDEHYTEGPRLAVVPADAAEKPAVSV